MKFHNTPFEVRLQTLWVNRNVDYFKASLLDDPARVAKKFEDLVGFDFEWFLKRPWNARLSFLIVDDTEAFGFRIKFCKKTWLSILGQALRNEDYSIRSFRAGVFNAIEGLATH